MFDSPNIATWTGFAVGFAAGALVYFLALWRWGNFIVRETACYFANHFHRNLRITIVREFDGAPFVDLTLEDLETLRRFHGD